MGTAGSHHAELRRCLRAGQFATACSAAHALPVVPLDAALDLTLLAAEKDPRRYEPMAVRWLARVAAEKKVPLSEFVWAATRLQDVREGRAHEAGPALRRWLAR